MGSRWNYAVLVLLQVLTFDLVFFSQKIEPIPDASQSITITYAVSKAAGTMVHVNILLVMLVNSVSFTWLQRKAFNHAFNATSPLYLSIMVFSVLHSGTFLAGPMLWSKKNKSHPDSFALLVATLKAGVGWSGFIMLLLLFVGAYIIMIPAPTRLPFPWASWYLYSWNFSYFALLLAAHEAFYVPDWIGKPFTAGPDIFVKFWSAGAVLLFVESIVLKVRPQRKACILKINQHPSDVFEIQFEKLTFRPTAGQHIVLDCPGASLVDKYRLALTSAPEDDYLSVHIRATDSSTRSLATLIKFTVSQPGKPHLYIDKISGASCEAVFNSQIAILVGSGNGVLPLASILKSIWYRMSSPRKATMVHKVYFFWICDNLENFKWFQAVLMALEAGTTSIETYLYLTGPFDEALATKHLINSAVHRIDLVTGLRNPTRHGDPDWRQIFADLAEHQGEMDSNAHILYSGPEHSLVNATKIRDEAHMSGLGRVRFSVLEN